MKLTHIHWRDAMTEEAGDGGEVHPQLYPLEEVGFLVAEDEEIVTICMELDEDTQVPGRFRLPWSPFCRPWPKSRFYALFSKPQRASMARA